MLNIPLSEILSRLPVEEMEQTLEAFTSPLSDLLPEKRLRRVVPLAIRGILTNETPVIAAMAQMFRGRRRNAGQRPKAWIGFWRIRVSIIITCSKGCIGWRNGR